MHRFYVPLIDPLGGTGEIHGEVAHQMTRVLRLRVGQRVAFFDGSGREQIVELAEIGANHVVAAAVSSSNPVREPPVSISLGIALIQHSRFEVVLQKATELGVAEVQPLTCDRSRSTGAEHITPERMRRWRQIIQEASEQSGRVVLPVLHDPRPITDIVAADGPARTLVLDTAADQDTAMPPVNVRGGVQLLIGPEGGWSPEERGLLSEIGASTVTLGPRTLRTETAAIAALAVLMAQVERWQLCLPQ